MTMMTTTDIARAHPALRAYAQRHGVAAEAFTSDGRMTLHIDRRYRVQMRPAADNRIALTTPLLELDDWSPQACEEMLLRLAGAGAGLMRAHAAGLAIDRAANVLQLQQQLPGATEVDALETELAGFVNILAFWTQACARERSRPRA